MTDKELDPDLSARLEKAIDKHLGKQPEPCDNVWCQQNEDKNKGWKSGCALFSDLNRCAIYRSWQSRPDPIGEIREWAKEELKLVEIFPEASVIVLFIKLERFLDKSEQEG